MSGSPLLRLLSGNFPDREFSKIQISSVDIE